MKRGRRRILVSNGISIDVDEQRCFIVIAVVIIILYFATAAVAEDFYCCNGRVENHARLGVLQRRTNEEETTSSDPGSLSWTQRIDCLASGHRLSFYSD